jgi:hypothetical protein
MWLINEIYSHLRQLKTDATFNEARLFLYVIEGTIIQLLDNCNVAETEKVLDYFLLKLGLVYS